MKLPRLIIIITPLLLWLISQATLVRPSLFYSSLTGGALLIILSVKYVGDRQRPAWFLAAISPILFWLSFSAYTAVIVSPFWIQTIDVLVVWFIFSYLKNWHYYSLSPAVASTPAINYAAKLDNLLTAGGFLSAWAAAAVLLALPAFLSWPVYFLLPAVAAVTALLFLQFNFLPAATGRSSTLFLGLNVLILTELVWTFSLLPLNFNILALFFAIAYYLGRLIMRLYLAGGLNWRAVKLPLIFSAIAIFILFLTSRWL